MATMQLKTRQEVEDFVRGCAFYGTGGGGLPVNGIRSLMSQIEANSAVGWLDLSEIADDQLCVCPFLMGTIAPRTQQVLDEMHGFGLTNSLNDEKNRLANAVVELEKYINKKFDVIVPIELGGANTAGAVAAASKLGILVVDGDYTSRAIPEIIQITPNYQGKSLFPIASVDEWGNVCIIKHAVNPRVTEKIGKLISCGGYGLAGQAGIVVTGKELKEIVIPGTLTECYDMGKKMRLAKENGQDVAELAAKVAGGFVLCKGRIIKKEDRDEGGYYWGTVTIDAGDETYKYWFKNENHIVWKNDLPYVTSPDIITAIDRETGEPIANPESYVGQSVTLLGIPCKAQLETPECHAVLAPKYFGFDIEHRPISEVMNQT